MAEVENKPGDKSEEGELKIIENKSVVADKDDISIDHLTENFEGLGFTDCYDQERINPYKPLHIESDGYVLEYDGVVVPGSGYTGDEDELQSRGPPGRPVASEYYQAIPSSQNAFGQTEGGFTFRPNVPSPGMYQMSQPANYTPNHSGTGITSNLQALVETPRQSGKKRTQDDEPTAFIKGFRPEEHVVTRGNQLSGGSVTRGRSRTVKELLEEHELQKALSSGMAPTQQTFTQQVDSSHMLNMMKALECDDNSDQINSLTLPSFDEEEMMKYVKQCEETNRELTDNSQNANYNQMLAPAVTEVPPKSPEVSLLRRKSDESSGPGTPDTGYATCSSPGSPKSDSRPSSYESDKEQENILDAVLSENKLDLLPQEAEDRLNMINEYVTEKMYQNTNKGHHQQLQQQVTTDRQQVIQTVPVRQGQPQQVQPVPQVTAIPHPAVGMQIGAHGAPSTIAPAMVGSTVSYLPPTQTTPLMIVSVGPQPSQPQPQKKLERAKSNPRPIQPAPPGYKKNADLTPGAQNRSTPGRPVAGGAPNRMQDRQQQQSPRMNTSVTPNVPIAPRPSDPAQRGDPGLRRPMPEILTDNKMKTRAHRQISGLKLEDILKRDDDGDMWLHAYIMHLNENSNVIYMIHAIISRLKREHTENKINIKEVINTQNSSYQTPVYLATVMNNQWVLDWLLRAGGNPNIMAISNTQVRKAPIHYAVSYGDQCLDVLYVLLECRETDLNLKNTEGYSPLHVAILSHNKPIRNSQSTVNSRRVIEALIQTGADLDQGDGKSGKTPIQYLVETKDFALIKSIFDVIPEKDLRRYLRKQTLGGNTALHIAAQSVMSNKDEHKKIIKLLVERGADPSVKNFENQTASQVAYRPHKDDLQVVLKSTHKSNHSSNAAHSPGGSSKKLPAAVVPAAAPSGFIYVQTMPTVQLMPQQGAPNQQPQIVTIQNNNNIAPQVTSTLQMLPQNGTVVTAPATSFTIQGTNQIPTSMTGCTLAQNANTTQTIGQFSQQQQHRQQQQQQTPIIIPRQVPTNQNYQVTQAQNILPLGSPQMAQSPPQVPSPEMCQAYNEYILQPPAAVQPNTFPPQTNTSTASNMYVTQQEQNVDCIKRFLNDNAS